MEAEQALDGLSHKLHRLVGELDDAERAALGLVLARAAAADPDVEGFIFAAEPGRGVVVGNNFEEIKVTVRAAAGFGGLFGGATGGSSASST